MPCLASPLQVLAGLGSAASPFLSFCNSADGAVTHSQGQVATVLSLWSTAPPERALLAAKQGCFAVESDGADFSSPGV